MTRSRIHTRYLFRRNAWLSAALRHAHDQITRAMTRIR